MAKKARYTFAKKTFYDNIMKNVVREQTARLIAYAKEELYEMIVSKTFKSRTFNLADSYVYAVYYDGKEQAHGYVGAKMANKQAIYRDKRNPSKEILVDGRKEATEFLTKFKSALPTTNGWVVVWAACAPYAKYLDPAVGSTKTNRFFVISQRYDHIANTFSSKGVVSLKVM